jgi:hypothetical protein
VTVLVPLLAAGGVTVGPVSGSADPAGKVGSADQDGATVGAVGLALGAADGVAVGLAGGVAVGGGDGVEGGVGLGVGTDPLHVTSIVAGHVAIVARTVRVPTADPKISVTSVWPWSFVTVC